MQKRVIAGNTATGILKLLALVFMMCDHAGKMLLPNVPEMRMLGRIAFPLYTWCMVVGFHYTRSVPRYLLRIALIGLASQPLYMLALNHAWYEPNIFLTLLLGLCALWGLREKKWYSHLWAPIAALALAVLLDCDYGWKGVLLMMLLYAARTSRSAIAAVMIAFCLYWGSSSSTVYSVLGISLQPLMRSPLSALISPWLRLQGLAVLALPLMVFPFPKDYKMPVWLSYALYPAHLLILFLLEQLV